MCYAVILLVQMFTKYTLVRILYFAEENSITEQVKFVIFYFTLLWSVFGKLDGIRKQYCNITTKQVYCSTLCIIRMSTTLSALSLQFCDVINSMSLS